MICHTCQNLLRRVEDLFDPDIKEPGYPHLDHHVTIDSLLEAVTAGCFICRKLKDEVPDFGDAQKCPPGSAKPLNYYSIFARQPRQSGPPDLKICFMTSYYGGGAPTVILRPLSTSYLNPSPAPLPPSTGHPLVLNCAALWLTTCLTEHHVCNQYFTRSDKIPSRLLDLCPSDMPKGSFRLIDSSMLTHDQPPYVTLSHRWGTGSHKPFQLTQLTRNMLFGGLPVDTLSGLFQDAVKVVLILNLRYLWIDSLCIFQDDTQNIVAEAQNMSVVYGNAICNIAALTAAQETMFAEREPDLISPSTTIIHAQQDGTSHSYAIADGSLWTRSIFKPPLSHRGWVLQEQILARRTLYFGQEQLLWSCPSSASCETYPMDDNVWNQDRFFVFQKGFDQIRKVSSGCNSLVPSPIMSSRQVDLTPERCWRQIVEEYATRQLTHASDKLLALAGVAKSLEQVTDDTLLAGMWRKEMPLNLLWIVGSSTSLSESRRYPATFRKSSNDSGVPSWSWASRDGPVTFSKTDSKSTKTIAQVNDVCMTTPARSTNQTMPSWNIHLRAAALKIVRWDEKRPWYGFLPRSDSSSKKIAVTAVTHFDMFDSEVTKMSYIAVFITCMIIYDRKSERSVSATYDGLILDRTKDNTRQVYTRVGTFQVREDFRKDESEQFMPVISTLADFVVDDAGRVEYPPVEFDVDWMQTFVIC